MKWKSNSKYHRAKKPKTTNKKSRESGYPTPSIVSNETAPKVKNSRILMDIIKDRCKFKVPYCIKTSYDLVESGTVILHKISNTIKHSSLSFKFIGQKSRVYDSKITYFDHPVYFLGSKFFSIK